MKKLFILSTLLTILCLTAQAQDARFGVKGGFNLNSYALQNLESSGIRLGIQLGVLAEIGLENSDLFYVQPEVLFTTKGAKYNVNTIEVKENHSYIDVPVLLKFKPLDIVHLFAGPQISFLASGNYKYQVDGGEVKIDDRETFKNLDFGLAAGLGITVYNILVDLRYNLGLGNVIDNRIVNDVLVDNAKARNRGFQLSACYFFGE